MNIDFDQIEFTIDDQLFFDTLKLMIRGRTIPYCAQKKRDRIMKETELYVKLEQEENEYRNNPSDSVLQNLEQTRNELKKLVEEKAKGNMIRAKARWLGEGEKCTKYFCNLEKRHFLDKTISKLIVEDREIFDIGDILSHQKNYYESLYQSRNCFLSAENRIFFFNNDNQYYNFLDQEDTNECEGKITKSDCFEALKQMKNNKSPGSDGFTVEFYKFFWKDIGDFLVRSINYAFESGKLSIMQRQGIIISIPKQNKDRNFMKNWRPISLLNVDYKIASTVIACRIKNKISKLISDTQKGFIKGRHIGECTRLMYDLLLATEDNNIPGMILLIDFEKAFDSIDFNFILETLDFFGFGPDMCHWVKTFYKDITSSVVNNGHISQPFSINRGVRQGDPLSPYLFILVAEILSCTIKWNPNIKGITLNDTEFLISQYADDTSLFLDGSEKSLAEALDTIQKFGICSGLKMNIEKTNIIWIGSKRNYTGKLLNIDLNWNRTGKFKSLGIDYDINKQDPTMGNFEIYLEKVKKLLKMWTYRTLTMIGKLIVFKSLALSKFVHLFMTLPDPPMKFFDDLESIMFKFLWGEKRDRIKRKVIINTIENGGLNVPHIKSFAKSLKFIWIKKLLNADDISPWKTLLLNTLIGKGGNLLWSYDPKMCKLIMSDFNNFWKCVISGWFDSQDPFPSVPNAEDILGQSLWYNSRIQIDGKPIFYEDWFRCGIWHINDLCRENGGFLSYDEFTSLYLLNTDFLQYHGILSAIPRIWKKTIKFIKPIDCVYHPLVKVIQGLAKPNRLFYSRSIDKIAINPQKIYQRWEKEIPEINQLDWADIFTITKQLTKDTKLQMFQYQILHNILVTNSKLVYYKIKTSNLCTFCNESKETIIHLFFECKKTKLLFIDLMKWLGDVCGMKIPFLKSNLLVGLFPVQDNLLQNLFILYFKRYVYLTRCNNKNLNIISLKEFIKHNIYIEKVSNIDKWMKKWNTVGTNVLQS